MNFLSPWYIPALAAALTIPPLVIMYFLRLRRTEAPVPSTYLWKRAVQDLQVNVPFQKLRRNLLLLLQLLVLLAGIFAFARPVRHVTSISQQRVVLLIDRSASMAVREGRSARLELAKDEALALLKGLRRGQQAMVVAFADTAEVICPFTADKNQVAERIRSIQPSDRVTRLDEAVRLAKAYATPIVIPEDQGAQRAAMVDTQPPAKAVIFSDGAIARADQINIGRLELEFVPIGEAAANAGITAIEARREYTDPEQVQLFLRVQNFSPGQATKLNVAVHVNDQLASVQDVELPPTPRAPASQSQDAQSTPPSSASRTLTFDLQCPDAAVIEAVLRTEDALTADDAARVILPPAKRATVLLVSGGNVVLERALAALPLQKVDLLAPEAYEGQFDKMAAQAYDLVIFDRYSPNQLANGNFLFIAAVPSDGGFGIGEATRDAAVVDFDLMHPIMRHVSIDEIRVEKWRPVQLPEGATILLETDRGAGIAYLSQLRRQMVVLGFDLFESLWPLQASFPVFMYNAVRHMTGSAVQADRALQPGQAAEIHAPKDLKNLAITTPDRQRVSIEGSGQNQVRFLQTEQVGLYRVGPEGVGVRPEAFAVNLADANESDVAVRPILEVGTQEIAASGSLRGANQALWPYAILAALIVLGLEWYIYNRRVMI